MKTALVLAAALLLPGAGSVLAKSSAAPGTWGDSLRPPPGWKRLRLVELNTSTDNGGEMQVFGSGSSRKIRVVIGLSSALVQTDYTFRHKKLVLVDITRTYFTLGEDGIDFTKPSLIQNGRYGFRNGRLSSRLTRKRDIGGRWKYGVEVTDKMDARTEIEAARFYLKVAGSGQKQADIVSWIRSAR